MVRSTGSLLLEHAVPAPQLGPILASSRSVGTVFDRLGIILSALRLGCGTPSLNDLAAALRRITLSCAGAAKILVIGIMNLVYRVLTDVELVVGALVLQCLVLRVARDARFLEVL